MKTFVYQQKKYEFINSVINYVCTIGICFSTVFYRRPIIAIKNVFDHHIFCVFVYHVETFKNVTRLLKKINHFD